MINDYIVAADIVVGILNDSASVSRIDLIPLVIGVLNIDRFMTPVAAPVT